MTANTPQTIKAKGRVAAQQVKELLLCRFTELQEDDIIVKSSGVTGEDLYLSPLARKTFPYCIEIKNCERIDIWGFIKQAESHMATTGYPALLIFKRNRSDFYVVMPLINFLKQYKA